MLYPENEPEDRLRQSAVPGGPDPRVQVFHDPARAERGGDHAKDERSLGQLFAELTRETQTLVKQEIELATTEMSGKVGKLGKAAGLAVAGGLLAYAGLIVLLFAIAYLLADLFDGNLGLATLIVAVVTLVVAGLIAMSGLKKLKSVNLKPERTIHTLQEDKQWLKETI